MNVEDDDPGFKYSFDPTSCAFPFLIVFIQPKMSQRDDQPKTLQCNDGKEVVIGADELRSLADVEPAFRLVLDGSNTLERLGVSSVAFNLIRFCTETGQLPNNEMTQACIKSGDALNACYTLGGFSNVRKLIQEEQNLVNSKPPEDPSDYNAHAYEWRHFFKENNVGPDDADVKELQKEGFDFASTKTIGVYTYVVHYRRLKNK